MLQSVWRPAFRPVMSSPFEPAATGDPLLRAIRELFANGEEGALYYFTDDFAGLYQDAAGTTPVTAVGQPVGLMLDRRFGLERGPELVPDPGFNDPGAWVLNGRNVIENGVLVYDADTGADDAVIAGEITSVSGAYYEVTIDFKRRYSGSFLVRGFNIVYTQSGDAQRRTMILQGNGGIIGIRTYSGGRAEIQELSIRELPGNHASQATTTARPTLSARVNLVTRTEGPLASLSTNGAPVAVVDAPEAIEGFSSSYYFGDNSERRSLYLSRYMADEGTTTFSVFIQMDDDGIPVFGEDFRFYVKGGPINTGAEVTHVRGSLYRVSYTTADSGSFTGVQKLATHSNRGFRVAGYQVEFGSVATKYQRVTTATDYDWQGFPLYLAFDGVDDSVASGNVDLQGTADLTLSVVAAPTSYKAPGNIASHPSAYVASPHGGQGASIQVGANAGTPSAVTRWGMLPNPVFSATLLANAPQDLVEFRLDGQLFGVSAADQGGNTYLNGQFRIGSRTTAAAFFNGHIYGAVLRGASSDATQVATIEKFLSGKAEVPA